MCLCVHKKNSHGAGVRLAPPPAGRPSCLMLLCLYVGAAPTIGIEFQASIVCPKSINI